jgi:TolB-like protein
LVVLLAWTYEINPDGIHRYSDTAGMQETGIRPRSAYLLLVVVAGALAASTLLLDVPGRVEAGPLPANRVAVLYFDDFSPDESLRHMVDGLTEALIQELSAVPGLEVVSRNGVKPFEDADIPVDSIARALGSGTLVQGSVAESAGRLRVTVQLIDGATGTVLAREALERPRGELFALQDDLAQQVARFLRRRLGEEIRLAELRAGTQSVAAWELVQRARQLRESATPMVEVGSLDEAGRLYDRADSLLATARAADTLWLTPIVQRGWLAHERSLWYAFSDFADFDRWSRIGLDHARTAVRWGGVTDPDVLELRGTLRLYRALIAPESDPSAAEAQWEDALQDLRASIEANPEQAGAWSKLSIGLAARGRPTEALAAAERAYEVDAYLRLDRETLWRLFAMSFDIPLAEEARRYCEEGRRLFPEEPDFHRCGIWLMTIPQTEPDPARAWSLLREVDRLAPPQEVGRDKITQMAVGAVLARAGLRDSALAVAARARSDEAEDPAREMMYFEAFVRTQMGQEDEAMDLLEAYLAASPGQRPEVASTWWFDALQDRADFRALVGLTDSIDAPER